MPLTSKTATENGTLAHGSFSCLVAQDPLIRDAECAFMMGCSKATFWRRVADGTIPAAIKIGGMSRWRLSDIEAVICKAEANRTPSAA